MRTQSITARTVAGATLILLVCHVGHRPSEAADPRARAPSHTEFWQRLAEPTFVAWSEQSLREGLQRLAERQGIQIWLDRRLDPDQRLDITTESTTVLPALEAIAARCDATAIPVAPMVIIAPRAAGDRLALQALQRQHDQRLPPRARNPITTSLPMLTTPRQAIHQLAEAAGVSAETELIPHDLLPELALRDVEPATVIELLAGGFDLTTDWSDQRVSIRKAPAPKAEPVLSLEYRAPEGADSLIKRFRAQAPRAKAARRSGSVSIVGTARDHAVWELLRAGAADRSGQSTQPAPANDPRARLTLRVVNKPLDAVLSYLGKSLNLNVDTSGCPPQLLQRMVTLEANEETLDQLLQSLTEQGRVTIERKGDSIVVTAGDRPPK